MARRCGRGERAAGACGHLTWVHGAEGLAVGPKLGQVGLARAAGVEQAVFDPEVARREEGIDQDPEHRLEKQPGDAVPEARGGRQPHASLP